MTATPYPKDSHAQILDDVALEVHGGSEPYVFSLVLDGTLVEVEEGGEPLGIDECVEATVSTAFTADELRVLGQALIAAADRAPLIGSGYRPSAWCPACHAPYRADAARCPECGLETL